LTLGVDQRLIEILTASKNERCVRLANLLPSQVIDLHGIESEHRGAFGKAQWLSSVRDATAFETNVEAPGLKA
jgi:hypothetical protein